MKPRTPADQFPPWPGAKVDPASYMAVPGEAVTVREKRLLDKMAVARALASQAIVYLMTDAYGNPREPSLNEREALETLHRIDQELAP